MDSITLRSIDVASNFDNLWGPEMWSECSHTMKILKCTNSSQIQTAVHSKSATCIGETGVMQYNTTEYLPDRQTGTISKRCRFSHFLPEN